MAATKMTHRKPWAKTADSNPTRLTNPLKRQTRRGGGDEEKLRMHRHVLFAVAGPCAPAPDVLAAAVGEPDAVLAGAEEAEAAEPEWGPQIIR